MQCRRKPLLMNALWLLEDQATTAGSTVFIKLSFHFKWFKSTLMLTNPLLWFELLWCPSLSFFFFSNYFIFVQYTQVLRLPSRYIFLEWQYQFLYVVFSAHSFFSSMAFLSEKAFPSTCMHLYTKVRERITGGWCLYSRRRFTRVHT